MPPLLMVLRAGEWCQDVERCRVEPNSLKFGHILFDARRCVERQAQNIPCMAGNAERVAMVDESFVFRYLVLKLLLRAEVLAVHAFYAEERLVTPRPRRKREEISAGKLPSGEIALHHKCEWNLFFLA